MTTRIVVLDRGTLPQRPFAFDFPHELVEYAHTRPEETATRVADAEIIITNKVTVDAAMIEANPHLKMIAIAATGFEHVDVAAAKQKGVVVSNIRAYGNDAVAEHAFMLMMALMRQLPAYQRDVAAGLWSQSPYFCHFGAPIHDVNGKTLGIFGRGGIGQALARRAEAFGMNIIWGEHKYAATCREGYVPFETVIRTADVISLHCPLNQHTRHMIAESELQQMKAGAVLINVGRGGLVDEQALVAALKYGQLGGAGFDVLTEEPPPADHPLLKTRLPHLIVTPHMAWGSVEAMDRLFDMLADNINAFMRGQAQSCL
ncbi:glycerate dehydrogenase [Neisseria sp. HSC-16F19]|nr:D-2-hydroxyacid dehydrogenase [Neisseria sp. HSC-16F19]MCP2039969.1 glycerate dehydrogenase [Neisseria sp. HSC-16F19]